MALMAKTVCGLWTSLQFQDNTPSLVIVAHFVVELLKFGTLKIITHADYVDFPVSLFVCLDSGHHSLEFKLTPATKMARPPSIEICFCIL